MTKRAERQQQRLPMWATLLICFVVLTICTVGTSAVSFFMFARRIAIDATIPERMQHTALAIAQFPVPLPAAYKYLMAADFQIMRFLVIEHEPTHQQIAFYGLSGLASEKDAKNLLDRAYDVGINTVYSVAKFHDLKTRGTEKVAGQEMSYLIGEFTDTASERKADGLVGCISLNKAAKNILIYSYPDRVHAYNQQVTMDLLKTIKGF